MATITETPCFIDGAFEFAGRFGPPNETMAPEHLAICIVYDECGCATFGSYVVYPSTARRGPSKSYVLVKGDGSLAGANEFNRAMIHASDYTQYLHYEITTTD